MSSKTSITIFFIKVKVANEVLIKGIISASSPPKILLTYVDDTFRMIDKEVFFNESI